MKNTRRNIYMILAILWFAIIFILCTIPSGNIPKPGIQIPHFDKVVHFGMFFIMSLLICGAFESEHISGKRLYFRAILFSLIYGGSIEILQESFFQRSGDLLDLSADVAGGVGGCLFYPMVKKIERYLFSKKHLSVK